MRGKKIKAMYVVIDRSPLGVPGSHHPPGKLQNTVYINSPGSWALYGPDSYAPYGINSLALGLPNAGLHTKGQKTSPGAESYRCMKNSLLRVKLNAEEMAWEMKEAIMDTLF